MSRFGAIPIESSVDYSGLNLNPEQERYANIAYDLASQSPLAEVDPNYPSLVVGKLYQESRFNPQAVGPQNTGGRGTAKGIAQILDSTASELGLEDQFDPEQSIAASIRYDEINADRLRKKGVPVTTDNIFAAYNAGAGNVAKHGGVPPFEQTQDYITKIASHAGNINVTEPQQAPVEEVRQSASRFGAIPIEETQVAEVPTSRFEQDVPRETPMAQPQTTLTEQFVKGAHDATSSIVGLPVDVAQGAINLGIAGLNALGAGIPQIQGAIGGSENLKGIVQAPEPQTTGQEIARIGGQLIPAIPAGAAGIARLPQAVNTLGRIGQTAGAGFIEGTVLSEQETPGGQITEGAAGAVLGPAIGGILSAGGKLTKAGVNKIRGASRAGDTGAIDQIAKDIKADSLDADTIQAKLNQLGDDAVLADVGGENIKRLADVSFQRGGTGAETARNLVEARQKGALGRVEKSIKNQVGDFDNYIAKVDDVIFNMKAQAAPLYDAAYEVDIPITKDLKGLMTVNGELRPAIKTAWKHAQRLAADEGESIGELTASRISPKGLDLSKEVRLGRAEKLGFDTDTVYYHGSTFGDIDAFDVSKTSPESHFGRGIYLTSSSDDALRNYGPYGQDVINRIERKAEQIAGDLDLEYDDPKVIELAKQQMTGGTDGVVYPVYTKNKNIFDISDEGNSRLSYSLQQLDPEDYLDEAEGYIERADFDSKAEYKDALMEQAQELAIDDSYNFEPEGEVVDFIDSLRNNPATDDSVEQVIDRILEEAHNSEGIDGKTLDDIMRNTEWYSETPNGDIANNDVYSRALEDAGFDGVKHNADIFQGMDVESDARHLILFDPKNIKSVNSAFDPKQANTGNLIDNLTEEVPNLSTKELDYLKRGLDRVIERDTSPFGKVGTRGRSVNNIKKQMLGIVDEQNPVYKEARQVYSDGASLKRALDDGLKFLRKDADEITKSMSNLTPNEQEMFKQGAAKSLRNRIASAQDGADAYKRLTGNQLAREKIKAVVGEEGFEPFMKDLEREGVFAQTRQNFANSKTQPRQVKDAQVFGTAVDIATFKANPLPMIRRALSRFSDRKAATVDVKAKEIVEGLFATGIERNQLVTSLRQAATKATKAERAVIRRAVGIALGGQALPE